MLKNFPAIVVKYNISLIYCDFQKDKPIWEHIQMEYDCHIFLKLPVF